jgi:hypothetical protein
MRKSGILSSSIIFFLHTIFKLFEVLFNEIISSGSFHLILKQVTREE